MEKVIKPSIDDARRVLGSLGKERSTFKLTEGAMQMLEALGDSKGITELELLDHYATEVAVEPFASHFEKWLVECAPPLEEGTRHTRRLSTNTLRRIEDLAAKHARTRDQILEGLISYWARWGILDAKLGLAAVHKLIKDAEEVSPALQQIAEEARAAGLESLAYGQLSADLDEWEDRKTSLQRLVDTAQFTKDELSRFCSPFLLGEHQ
jgi:hypothetical protein